MRFFLASDGTDLIIIIVENPGYIINKCVEEDMVRNLKYCYEEFSDPIHDKNNNKYSSRKYNVIKKLYNTWMKSMVGNWCVVLYTLGDENY